jgi:hypothetical protein
LNPDDPADAGLDSDGDRFTNLQEFLCGTDPRNAASVLRFDSITCSNGAVELRFNAMAGKSYTVQYYAVQSASAWQKLADIAAGVMRPVDVTDPMGNASSVRFYRLVTPVQP